MPFGSTVLDISEEEIRREHYKPRLEPHDKDLAKPRGVMTRAIVGIVVSVVVVIVTTIVIAVVVWFGCRKRSPPKDKMCTPKKKKRKKAGEVRRSKNKKHSARDVKGQHDSGVTPGKKDEVGGKGRDLKPRRRSTEDVKKNKGNT